MLIRRYLLICCAANLLVAGFAFRLQSQSTIGREVAIPRHLRDAEEFEVPFHDLIRYGQALFRANFTSQEGAGRPLTKGTGAPLSDLNSPLVFPR